MDETSGQVLGLGLTVLLLKIPTTLFHGESLFGDQPKRLERPFDKFETRFLISFIVYDFPDKAHTIAGWSLDHLKGLCFLSTTKSPTSLLSGVRIDTCGTHDGVWNSILQVLEYCR